ARRACILRRHPPDQPRPAVRDRHRALGDLDDDRPPRPRRETTGGSAAPFASICAITLALTPSVLYATFGEIVGQRAGVVNLGIEGVMLIGASVGFATRGVTGNSYLGLLAGAGAGVVFNLLLALLVIGRRTNQLDSSFALYFLGGGISTLIGAKYVGRNLGGLDQIGVPGLSGLPTPWDQ